MAAPTEAETLSPQELVDEFKRQGHFDEIRKQLYRDLRGSERHAAFEADVSSFLLRYTREHADHLVYRDPRLRQSDLMHAVAREPLLSELVARVADMDGSSSAVLGEHGAVAQRIRAQLPALLAAMTDGAPQSAHDL